MARIWAVMKDPGGTNAMWPVVEELRKRRHSIIPIAHGKAIELLAIKKVSFIAAQNLAFKQEFLMNLPEIYITSMCSEGGIGRDLIHIFRSISIPTIAVQDYWGGAALTDFKNPIHWPNVVCAQDELAAEMILDAWPGYKQKYGRIEITGQPAFDALITLDTPTTKSKTRKMLGCTQEWPVILYAGQLQWSAVTLTNLIKAINRLQFPVYLLPTKHPRMAINDPEEETSWNEALARFNNGIILDKQSLSTDQCVAASDVVVSMTSTILATGAYLRKECIAYLPPEIFESELGSYGYKFLPMAKLGSCAVAENQLDLDSLLETALSKKPDPLGLRRHQEKNFKTDTKSASRVADVIEQTLGLKAKT